MSPRDVSASSNHDTSSLARARTTRASRRIARDATRVDRPCVRRPRARARAPRRVLRGRGRGVPVRRRHRNLVGLVAEQRQLRLALVPRPARADSRVEDAMPRARVLLHHRARPNLVRAHGRGVREAVHQPRERPRRDSRGRETAVWDRVVSPHDPVRRDERRAVATVVRLLAHERHHRRAAVRDVVPGRRAERGIGSLRDRHREFAAVRRGVARRRVDAKTSRGRLFETRRGRDRAERRDVFGAGFRTRSRGARDRRRSRPRRGVLLVRRVRDRVVPGAVDHRGGVFSDARVARELSHDAFRAGTGNVGRHRAAVPGRGHRSAAHSSRDASVAGVTRARDVHAGGR